MATTAPERRRGLPKAPSVWVIGLVARPGHYPFESTRSLAVALRAAGRRAGADLGAVEIERRLPRGSLKSVVDAKAILAGAKPDVPLEAGDSIIVPGVNW
jgi:protein involved in polysaccharide export with SLBB domain